MQYLDHKNSSFLVVVFSALLFIPTVSSADNTISVDESNVDGNIIGGDQTIINNPEPKSLMERIAGSWILMSYTHRPVVNGSQNDMYEPAYLIQEGNGTLNVSKTGRFVWKLTVDDNYLRRSNTRIEMTSTAQIKPNSTLSPIRGGSHNSTAYPANASWQHSIPETSLSIRGWNTSATDAFSVSTDSDGQFLEMENLRSTLVWVRN